MNSVRKSVEQANMMLLKYRRGRKKRWRGELKVKERGREENKRRGVESK